MIDDRLRITIHATPGARRNHVGGAHDGALRVSVTAAPDKGRANKAIHKQLADALVIKNSQLELISGQTSRRKVFVVSGSTVDMERRIEQLMKDKG